MNKRACIRLKIDKFYHCLSNTLTQGGILQSSIVIAYYILFSIFPIIIIIGNILPLFHLPTGPIAVYLTLIFPNDTAKYMMPVVSSLLKSHSTGYISFGIILALWSFSNLVNAIRIGMNRLYAVHQIELKLSLLNFLWNRSFTVLLTTLMIIVFTVVNLIFTFGQEVLAFLQPIFGIPPRAISHLFSYKYPVILLTMLIAVSYLNYVLPNIKLKKRIIWPGTIVTVACWFLLSWLFGFYLGHFPISWKNYGIIGTFIIFMLWLDLAAMLLLLGTSVNAALARMKYGSLPYSAGHVASYIQKRRHRKH